MQYKVVFYKSVIFEEFEGGDGLSSELIEVRVVKKSNIKSVYKCIKDFMKDGKIELARVFLEHRIIPDEWELVYTYDYDYVYDKLILVP